MPKVETSTAFEEASELVLLRKLGIPDRRREALPEKRTCVGCQSSRDASLRSAGINRRGSKDSQFR